MSQTMPVPTLWIVDIVVVVDNTIAHVVQVIMMDAILTMDLSVILLC